MTEILLNAVFYAACGALFIYFAKEQTIYQREVKVGLIGLGGISYFLALITVAELFR